MFMGPIEENKPWDNNGVVGARKFLDRVYRIFEEKQIVEKENENLFKIYNQTIKKVTTDYETLNFNTGISQLMIFVNALSKETYIPKYIMEGFLKMLNPVCPFITEELWNRLGHSGTISYEPWPICDESKIVEQNMELPIQVNGKLRAKIVVAKNLSEDEIKQKAISEVKEYLTSEPKKIIYISNRLVNIVV